MDGASEDRYPDFLGLRAAAADVRGQARGDVAELLAELPSAALVLNHDANANANAETLAKATSWM